MGNKVVLEGGELIEQEEIGTQKGTTIIISNLFYNTPVRYKFLKKDYTELGYIEDAVKRIALANPNVAIRLSNENKTIIKTNGSGELKTAIYSIYGKETTDGLIDVDYTYEDIRITGVIGKPEIARGNRSYQMFFVNKRFIKDKTLTAGVEQAFKGLLPIGKFGFLVLNLEMDPSKIDVNVHPTKLEVRFQEEQKVFKAVYHSIREGLLKGDLIKNTEKQEDENEEIKTIEPTIIPNVIQKNLEPAIIPNLVTNNAEPIITSNTEENNPKIQVPQSESISKIEPTIIPEILTNNAESSIPSIKTDNIQPNNSDIGEELLRKEEITANVIENNAEETTEEKNIAQISKMFGEELDLQDKDLQQTQKFEPIIEEKPEEKKACLFGLFRRKNDEEIEENVENNAIEEIYAYKKENAEKPIEPEKIETTSEEDFKEMYNKTFGINKEVKPEEKKETNTLEDKAFSEVKNISMFEDDEGYSNAPAYKYCGSVFSTYLIIQMENEMYLIDQHAAHERILYEEIKASYYNNPEKESQIMLLPDIITLSHKEKALVQENFELFKKAGFMLEEFGDNTVRLIGVPSICMEMDTKSLFLEILDTIDTVAITAKQEKEDRFIATIACKAAVKAGMNLTPEEVDNLLKKLLVLPNPFTCPHGRPTAIKMSKMDLEKKFFRRK